MAHSDYSGTTVATVAPKWHHSDVRVTAVAHSDYTGTTVNSE